MGEILRVNKFHGIKRILQVLFMNYRFILLTVLICLCLISVFTKTGYLKTTAENPPRDDTAYYKFNWSDIEKFENSIMELYNKCELRNKLEYDIFRLAIIGYLNMYRQLSKKRVITIIDYNQPSTKERCYVIDLKSKKISYNTLIAHGEKSGDNYSVSFSNELGTGKSSMGFYVTAETYYGRHGYALRLDGLEPSYNDNARKRGIVIHGSDYVSREYIKSHGMLGQSGGCPALPITKNNNIINTIKNGSCMFIYYSDNAYLNNSEYLNAGRALKQYIYNQKI